MKSSKTATIKDVAREAKVSVASVSRALNGSGGVTPETEKAVREAAARLRYVPDGAARSLITRRTHTIGALLPDLHGEFFSELIRGIDLAARANGLHLLVSSSHGDAGEAAAALRAMQGRVDGLLVMSPHADDDFLEANIPAGLPAVLMNTHAGGAAFDVLQVDNYGGARQVMAHLLASRRRRIAFVQGPAQNHDVQQREAAYRDALGAQAKAAGPIVLPGDFSEQSGYRAAQQLLALAKPPDAIFAANDMMAIGCMAAIREAGLRVPEDIAVAGFDDVPTARYVSPPLTTVRVRIAELGQRALARLAVQIGAARKPKRVQENIEVELVVRASSQSAKQ